MHNFQYKSLYLHLQRVHRLRSITARRSAMLDLALYLDILIETYCTNDFLACYPLRKFSLSGLAHSNVAWSMEDQNCPYWPEEIEFSFYFSFEIIDSEETWERRLHISLSYWLFVFLSVGCRTMKELTSIQLTGFLARYFLLYSLRLNIIFPQENFEGMAVIRQSNWIQML